MYVLLVLDSYLQPARVVPSLNPCSNSTNPPERGENFIIKLTRVRRGSWPAVCMVDSLPPLVRSLDSLPPKQKRACAAPLWRKVRERVSLEQDRKTSQRRHAQSTQFPQPLDNWIPSVFPPPPHRSSKESNPTSAHPAPGLLSGCQVKSWATGKTLPYRATVNHRMWPTRLSGVLTVVVNSHHRHSKSAHPY